MRHKSIDILLIEDTPTDAEIVQRMLRGRAQLHWVQTLADAATALREKTFDLIVTDFGLPDSSGIETVVELRRLTDGLPIIALTGQDDDELGLQAIQSGANDYIPKNVLSEPIISKAIAYTLERFQMAKKIVDANRMLESKNKRLAQMYKMSQQFVDNVSHEFRTPLTVIREFAAIVRDGIDGPVTESQRSRLSTLINRTDDLSNMVDDLLDTSRLESGLLKTCREEHDLSDIITRVEKMLRTRAENKKVHLEIGEVPQNLAVFCDEEKLRRVLVNLLVNAIKFTPVDGQITISAKMADEHRVCITVSDTGPGIAADELHRIFERFQQVEAHHRMASCKGFGLGLSIARALASLNLGSLQVNSVLGEGSQFSVLVPIANMESILKCYFDQRATTLEESLEISLLEVYPASMVPGGEQEIIETIDEFIRSSFKSFDLVLKVQESRWSVLTCSSVAGVSELKSRIQEEWAKLARNHYGVELPSLIFDYKATGNAVEGREKLMQLTHQTAKPPARPLATENLSNEKTAKRVLVFDDEVEVANALESRLSASGFDVTVAYDGPSGLDAVEQVQPDAILLDIRMPKMDGFAVLGELKSNPATASTPVVVLSASLHDKQGTLDRGATFFVQKPFQSESLLAVLNAAVKNRKSNQTEASCE